MPSKSSQKPRSHASSAAPRKKSGTMARVERPSPLESSARAIVDASREIIFVHSGGIVIHANATAVAALGYDHVAELVGRPFSTFVDAKARFESAPARGPVAYLCRDGRTRSTETATLPIVFDGAPATLALATDVTDRDHMLLHLVRADRLAALGTLCTGAAHEINNPLTYTLLNIEHTLRKLKELPSGGGALTRVQIDDLLVSLSRSMDGLTRVSELGRNLTLFARGGGTERRALVHVQNALESSVQMTMHEIRHRARLVRDFRDVPPVDANETSLGQVFINLLVNAAQSIPEGNVANNEVRVSTLTDARGNVVVEVADTGVGIDPETVGRIFDPFYTSKQPGSGTGLGLSISRAAIEALGGEITVTSAVGVGSKFRVMLPPSVRVQRATSSESQLAVAPRTARVLIVDDEDLVGDAITRALATECNVTHAASGREALALFAGGASYDVILCDVMMPDLSIMDLHAETTRVAPALADRIVFMTGGAFTPKARAFLESVGRPCVEKPLGLDRLREVVQGCRAATR